MLLVAAMLVNNEIGVIQPVAEIARHGARGRRADAVRRSAGARPAVAFREGPDLVAVSAHKIHGPKGIGALWMREGAEPAPLIHGGGQERGMRSGTLSPALCVGFGAAAKLAAERCERDYDHVQRLWTQRPRRLGRAGRSTAARRTAITAISTSAATAVDAARLLADLREIAFSLGIGLRQRLGAAEPRAARARPRLSPGALVDPARLRPLHDAAGADRRLRRIAAAARAQEHLVA